MERSSPNSYLCILFDSRRNVLQLHYKEKADENFCTRTPPHDTVMSPILSHWRFGFNTWTLGEQSLLQLVNVTFWALACNFS